MNLPVFMKQMSADRSILSHTSPKTSVFLKEGFHWEEIDLLKLAYNAYIKVYLRDFA